MIVLWPHLFEDRVQYDLKRIPWIGKGFTNRVPYLRDPEHRRHFFSQFLSGVYEPDPDGRKGIPTEVVTATTLISELFALSPGPSSEVSDAAH